MPRPTELEPRSLSFCDTAPFVAEAAAIVDADPEEAWAVLVDHRAWPSWFGAVKACEPTSAEEAGVGSTRRVVLPGGLTIEEEFIAWDRPRRWAFTATAGPGVITSLVECVDLAAAEGGGTTLTYRMAAQPRRGAGTVFALARPAVSANLGRSLGALGQEALRRRGGDGRSG